MSLKSTRSPRNLEIIGKSSGIPVGWLLPGAVRSTGVYQLQRSIQSTETTMDLNRFRLLGISHRTADVAVREAFAIHSSELPRVFQGLRRCGVESAVVLSTCNRTEFYALADDWLGISQYLEERLSSCDIDLEQCSYQSEGVDAFTHLFRVSSGLDSQALGEKEILGQLKRALAAALEFDFAGGPLQGIFDKALQCGKRVRSETVLGDGAVSVASLSVRLAFERLGARGCPPACAIIGTGEMGERVAREFQKAGIRDFPIFSNTERNARRLADLYGGIPYSVAAMSQMLGELNLIVSATVSPHPVLDGSALQEVDCSSAGIVLVDLGMPRNIDTSVLEVPCVTLFNLDDVKAYSDAQVEIRRRSVPHAEEIISEEVGRCCEMLKTRAAGPYIRALKEQAELVREQQVDWALKKLGDDLTREQHQVIEQFSRRVVNSLLSRPFSKLKELQAEEEVLHHFAEFCGVSSLDD